MSSLMPKLLSEVITVDFNFRSEMEWGEALDSAVVSVEVFSGLDYAPELLLDGTASVGADLVTVTQSIQAGLPGVVYLLIATAEGSSGASYVLTKKLAVLSDTGSYQRGQSLQLVGALPSGTTRVPYSESLTITGGYPPYEFDDIAAGTAPGWMSFNVVENELVCAGTSHENETLEYVFTPQVRDQVNSLANDPQDLTMLHLVISGHIENGITGTAPTGGYSQVNGVLPVTYEVTAGTFPPGITLGTDGIPTGSYTTAGSFAWTVTGTDAVGNTDTLDDSNAVLQAAWLAVTSLGAAGTDEVYVSTDQLATFGITTTRSPFIEDANLPCALSSGHMVNSQFSTGGTSTTECYTSLDFSEVLIPTIVTISTSGSPVYRLKYIEGIVFACLNSGEIYKSVNEGASWDHVYTARNGPADITKVGGNWVLYDIGAPTYLKYSGDLTLWNTAPIVDPNTYSGFMCNGLTCVVVSNNTDYYITVDGVNWSPQVLPEDRTTAPQSAIAIDSVFMCKITTYTGEGTQIWRSVNSGTDFVRTSVSASVDGAIDGFAYGNGLVVCWTSSRVYKSVDFGENWTQVTMPTAGSWGLTYVVGN